MPIDWNVTVLAALGVGLLVGVGLGVLLRGRSAASDRARAEQLDTDLSQTREELETHRDEVARHFQATSELFRDVTEQYSRLYTHLAAGARAFSTDAVPALGGLETPLLGHADDTPADESRDAADAPDVHAAEETEAGAAPEAANAAPDADDTEAREPVAAAAPGETRVGGEAPPSVKPNGGLGAPPPLAPPPA